MMGRMYYIALEVASAENEHDRYNMDPEAKGWEPIASAQSRNMSGLKALMLDNVLEMLNDESLLPKNEWLRLVYYDSDRKTVLKVEVF